MCLLTHERYKTYQTGFSFGCHAPGVGLGGTVGGWGCQFFFFFQNSFRFGAGFYIKLNVWGSLGLNFEYDGGPIIEIGGPIFLYKLRILEGSTSFREGSV